MPAIGMGDGLVKTGEEDGGGVQEFPHSACSFISTNFIFWLFYICFFRFIAISFVLADNLDLVPTN